MSWSVTKVPVDHEILMGFLKIPSRLRPPREVSECDGFSLAKYIWQPNVWRVFLYIFQTWRDCESLQFHLFFKSFSPSNLGRPKKFEFNIRQVCIHLPFVWRATDLKPPVVFSIYILHTFIFGSLRALNSKFVSCHSPSNVWIQAKMQTPFVELNHIPVADMHEIAFTTRYIQTD